MEPTQKLVHTQPGTKMTDDEFQLYLKQIQHLAENEFDEMQKEV